MSMCLVDRRHQVGQRHALEVFASFEDAGGCLLGVPAVGGHGDQPCDGLAVARDGQALAPRGAVEQPGQDASGRGSADLVHRGPRFGFA